MCDEDHDCSSDSVIHSRSLHEPAITKPSRTCVENAWTDDCSKQQLLTTKWAGEFQNNLWLQTHCSVTDRMSTLRGRCAFLGRKLASISSWITTCSGDSTVGKSALAQFFHSDGSHYPKTYTMVHLTLCARKPSLPCPDSRRWDSEQTDSNPRQPKFHGTATYNTMLPPSCACSLTRLLTTSWISLGVLLYRLCRRRHIWARRAQLCMLLVLCLSIYPSTHLSMCTYLYTLLRYHTFYMTTPTSLTCHQLEDISLVVLVFDMTSRATFDSLRTWYNVLLQKNTSQLLGGIIVANKSDMATIRDVTEEEGRALASELGLEYFETSAVRLRLCFPSVCVSVSPLSLFRFCLSLCLSLLFSSFSASFFLFSVLAGLELDLAFICASIFHLSLFFFSSPVVWLYK